MELDILREIQKISNPLLDIIIEGITVFGEKMIIMAVFGAIYWCIDKRLGRFLAISLGFSLCVNGFAKDFFKVERLFGADGIISRRIETATGYSFPSGHTQAATVFGGGIAAKSKLTWLRIVSAALVPLVGFSRLYLGVHYPSDVAGGIVIGLACLLLVHIAGSSRFGKAAVLLLCLVAVVSALLIGESPDTFKGAGMLVGILTGLYFEEKLAGFETYGLSLPKKLMRYSLAMAVVGLCYIVPKLLLPQTNPVDFVRYAFLTFTATGFCPYLFIKFKI